MASEDGADETEKQMAAVDEELVIKAAVKAAGDNEVAKVAAEAAKKVAAEKDASVGGATVVQSAVGAGKNKKRTPIKRRRTTKKRRPTKRRRHIKKIKHTKRRR